MLQLRWRWRMHLYWMPELTLTVHEPLVTGLGITNTRGCACGPRRRARAGGNVGHVHRPPEESESLPPSGEELGAGVTGLAVKFWPPNWQSTEPTPAGESLRETTLPASSVMVQEIGSCC